MASNNSRGSAFPRSFSRRESEESGTSGSSSSAGNRSGGSGTHTVPGMTISTLGGGAAANNSTFRYNPSGVDSVEPSPNNSRHDGRGGGGGSSVAGGSVLAAATSKTKSRGGRRGGGGGGGLGSVIDGGNRLHRINKARSSRFDDEHSVDTANTDKANNNNVALGGKIGQEMVDVSVDQEYGEFGETDPYRYKSQRNILFGGNSGTRDGVLRDSGLAVFTSRRQKMRYYMVFCGMILALVLIIGLSVGLTQSPKSGTRGAGGSGAVTGDNGSSPTGTSTTTNGGVLNQTTSVSKSSAETGDDALLPGQRPSSGERPDDDTVAPDAGDAPPEDRPNTEKPTSKDEPPAAVTQPPILSPALISCDEDDGTTKNPFVQCECSNTIANWDDDMLKRYNDFKTKLGPKILAGDGDSWSYEQASCHPHNMALAWMSLEGTPSEFTSDDGTATDRWALAVLFYRLGGVTINKTGGWKTSDKWLSTDTSMCNGWTGISCSPDKKRVTSIVLQKNNLKGSIPTELALMEGLESIDWKTNHLKGTIPPELFSLPNLSDITLSTNQLTGDIPTQIGQGTKLVNLALHLNNLEGTIPTELNQCTLLQYIGLFDNELEGSLEAGAFTNLSMLRQLLLNNNREMIGTIPMEIATSCPKLEELDLSNTKIKGSIPPQLGSLSALKFLVLEGNGLTGKIPTEIAGLETLHTLKLEENFLTGTIPEEFGTKASALNILELSKNKLTGTIPTKLGQASPYVTKMELHENNLQGPIPSQLGSIGSLQALTLNVNPKLTGPLPDEVCALRQANQLNVLIADCTVCTSSPKDCCSSC